MIIWRLAERNTAPDANHQLLYPSLAARLSDGKLTNLNNKPVSLPVWKLLEVVMQAITAFTVHAKDAHPTHTEAEQQLAPPARRAPIPRMPRPGPRRLQIAPSALSPVKPAITALTVHAKVARRTHLAGECGLWMVSF